MIRNQLNECARLGVTIEYGVGVWPGLVEERQPDHVIVATGAEPARPWWVPADADSNVARRARRARRQRRARARTRAAVVVIDEIGFHHATSVAELLADRGCTVEIVTNGMVVGQDLGITLDMENWWMRAGAKGIVQSDRPRADGPGRRRADAAAPPHRRATRHAPPDWVVLAVPPNPVEWLYHDLKAAGVSVRARRRLRRPSPRPRRRRSTASASAQRSEVRRARLSG